MDEHDRIESGTLPMDDPWFQPLAGGLCDQEPEPPSSRRGHAASAQPDKTAVYVEVQRSDAFQRVRRGYRRFVLPATAVFLIWYLLYVVAATAAPELMRRQVFGAVNVAMLAGLAQFATTFLLTWAYARNARLRRDRAALDLRWDTQERIR